jgi:hypothetical protein
MNILRRYMYRLTVQQTYSNTIDPLFPLSLLTTITSVPRPIIEPIEPLPMTLYF